MKTSNKEKETISYRVVEELFETCPFCGEKPNVFQVTETRYGENKPFGWVVECKSMGCMFYRSNPDQSFKHLMEEWNTRN